MQLINCKNVKRCVICKHWYDPTNSAIKPKAPKINLWEYDEKAKNMCLKRNIEMPAFAVCHKFECKWIYNRKHAAL